MSILFLFKKVTSSECERHRAAVVFEVNNYNNNWSKNIHLFKLTFILPPTLRCLPQIRLCHQHQNLQARLNSEDECSILCEAFARLPFNKLPPPLAFQPCDSTMNKTTHTSDISPIFLLINHQCWLQDSARVLLFLLVSKRHHMSTLWWAFREIHWVCAILQRHTLIQTHKNTDKLSASDMSLLSPNFLFV